VCAEKMEKTEININNINSKHLLKTMKKFFILSVAVAMMAMTACNEKPAKADADQQNGPATEQVDNEQLKKSEAKVDVEKAKPTEDGKDHTVAEFNTPDYQVRLENLADGTYRVSLWKAGADKAGKPEQVAETKQCVMKDDNYLMKTEDGTIYVISAKSGAEQLTIMKGDEMIYPKMK